MLFKITVTDTNKASKMKNREINRKGMLNLAKFKEDKTQCSTNKEDKKHFLHIPNNKYGKVDTKKLINLEHKSIEKIDKHSVSQSYDENSLESINEVENSLAESCSPKVQIKKRSNTNLIDDIKSEIMVVCSENKHTNEEKKILFNENDGFCNDYKHLNINQQKVK